MCCPLASSCHCVMLISLLYRKSDKYITCMPCKVESSVKYLIKRTASASNFFPHFLVCFKASPNTVVANMSYGGKCSLSDDLNCYVRQRKWKTLELCYNGVVLTSWVARMAYFPENHSSSQKNGRVRMAFMKAPFRFCKTFSWSQAWQCWLILEALS